MHAACIPCRCRAATCGCSASAPRHLQCIRATRRVHPSSQVPRGHVWLQGDNLLHSRDSREYGPIPLALVRGKVLCQVRAPRPAALRGVISVTHCVQIAQELVLQCVVRAAVCWPVLLGARGAATWACMPARARTQVWPGIKIVKHELMGR